MIGDRFWSKVNFDGPVPDYDPSLGPCWIWTASVDGKGYGKFWLNGRLVPSHRVSYEAIIGPIPEELVTDHLCRVHRCVRATHVEPVTEQVNILRGVGPSAIQARQTHCRQGHPLDEMNTYIEVTRRGKKRHCSICRDARRALLTQAGYDKQYRSEHRIEMRDYSRDWHKRNPAKAAEYTKRYRQRKAAGLV